MNPTFRSAAGTAASLLLLGLGACMSDLSVGVSEDLPDDEYGDTTGIRRSGSTQNTSRRDAGLPGRDSTLTPLPEDDGGLVSFPLPGGCTFAECNDTNGGATCSAVPTCGLYEGICQWKCEAVVTTIPNAPDNTGRGRGNPAPPDDDGSNGVTSAPPATTPPATTPPATTPPATTPPATTPPATTPPVTTPPADDGPIVRPGDVEPPKGSGGIDPNMPFPPADPLTDPVDDTPPTPPSTGTPATDTPSGGSTSPTGSGALNPDTTPADPPAPGGSSAANPSVSARGTEDAGTVAPTDAVDAGTPADAGASAADAGT